MSCKKEDTQDAQITYSNPIFKVVDSLEFNYNDFEMYDSSTKILYFKTEHPEFKDYKDPFFAFYTDTLLIYYGRFWSWLNSSIPPTPIIHSYPFFRLQNHALLIEYEYQKFVDPRNDERLISAFKNSGILHSGLSIEIKDLSINGTQISFSFMIKNNDQSDLLILDYDKMGTHLFHFYTNGLYFMGKDHPGYYRCPIDVHEPAYISSWEKEWLLLLKSGESKSYSIDYKLDSSLMPGNYDAYFNFPGLKFQIARDQLIQDNGRIWLGDITAVKAIKIQ